jgi:hypothetical protein
VPSISTKDIDGGVELTIVNPRGEVETAVIKDGKEAENPVESVNEQTGKVVLTASDVGARPDSWMPSATDVGAEVAGTASTAVDNHNTNTEAHNDIRLELTRLSGIINDVLDSEDINLNELHEIVDYIKSNSALIAAITVSKVNVADIINNLTTNVTDKPLSAAQGVELNKNKLDASKLTEAINTALAEAKASGEFDGVGIDEVTINNDGELEITYTDGNSANVGKVKGEDGVLTPEQKSLLETLKGWYDEEHYVSMTASIEPDKQTLEYGRTYNISISWSFKVEDKKAELSWLKYNEKEIDTNISSQSESLTTSKTYSVEAKRSDGNQETVKVYSYINVYSNTYFGCAPDPGNLSDYSSFVKGLKDRVYQALSRDKFTMTPNCPDGSYIWYASAVRFGKSTFKMNGFPVDVIENTVTVKNNLGDSVSYYLYRSIEPSLGSIEVQVL